MLQISIAKEESYFKIIQKIASKSFEIFVIEIEFTELKYLDIEDFNSIN